MQLGLTLLRDAVQRRDAEDVEWSLVVCFRFGFSPQHFDLLIELAFAEWHERHEDVASALGGFIAGSFDATVHLAPVWVPQYLAFDDVRALAVKAIWGGGAIPGAPATKGTSTISATAEDGIVARAAMQELDRGPDRLSRLIFAGRAITAGVRRGMRRDLDGARV